MRARLEERAEPPGFPFQPRCPLSKEDRAAGSMCSAAQDWARTMLTKS
jgi:hypothetical protein